MKTNSTILSVSDLTRSIKEILETGFVNVSVQGEISNCKHHSSGHLYFTLKDERSQLQGVMWRNRVQYLSFTPQDGMKVIVRGNITVYEARGNYQIDVVQIQPMGVGELQLAFEQLKQKLASEGLFDADLKKTLPLYPGKIGIVTSPTGAAIKDMINIISRRFPSVELILYPVKVQGAGAAAEIADAIDSFNTFGQLDVMIVGRGGGSLEDLWAFNEEIVARAIARSKIPIISAVGHEIDFTIADFVADMRAPTPSAAAELIVPDKSEIVEIVRNFCYTTQQFIISRLSAERENIIALLRSYSFNKPFDLVRQFSQQLDDSQRTLDQTVLHYSTLLYERVASLQKRMASVNPDAILERGYSIIIKDGKVINSAHRLRSNDEVEIKMHDGKVPATIQ